MGDVFSHLIVSCPCTMEKKNDSSVGKALRIIVFTKHKLGEFRIICILTLQIFLMKFMYTMFHYQFRLSQSNRPFSLVHFVFPIQIK